MATNQEDNRRPSGTGRGGGPSDVSRLSRSGTSLYELLDIPKTSTNEEIKKKYRRLALKYHPDKNPNNPEAEEMFKKINHAHSILSDEKKREIYDQYGSFGLYIAEQFGDEVVGKIMLFSSKWFQCLFWTCCIVTGCYFGCCLCCCCCCCCGKCKPDIDEDAEVPDIHEFEDAQDDPEAAGASGLESVVTSQPTVANGQAAASNDPEEFPSEVVIVSEPKPSASVAIPMPPPSTSADEPNETTALNSGTEKLNYSTGSPTSSPTKTHGGSP